MNIIKFKDILKEKDYETLIANQFSRPDHIFLGWTKSLEPKPNEDDTPLDPEIIENFTPEIVYTDKQMVNDITEDTDLYAVWKECWIKTDVTETINFSKDETEKTFNVFTKGLISDARIIINESNESSNKSETSHFEITPMVISKDAEQTEIHITFKPEETIKYYNVVLTIEAFGDEGVIMQQDVRLYGEIITTPYHSVIFNLPDSKPVTVTVKNGTKLIDSTEWNPDLKNLGPYRDPSDPEVDTGYNEFIGWTESENYKEGVNLPSDPDVIDIDNYIVSVPEEEDPEKVLKINLYPIHKKVTKNEHYEKINGETEITDGDKFFLVGNYASGNFNLGLALCKYYNNLWYPYFEVGQNPPSNAAGFEKYTIPIHDNMFDKSIYGQDLYFIKNENNINQYYIQVISDNEDNEYNEYICLLSNSEKKLNKNPLDESNKDQYLWTIKFESDGVHIKNVRYNKEIKYNISSPRFACYSSSQSMPNLFKYSFEKTFTYKTFQPVATVTTRTIYRSARRFVRPGLMNGMGMIPLTPALALATHTITYIGNGGTTEDGLTEYTQLIDARTEIYNTLYKGKYALWPRLTYVIPIWDIKTYNDIEINGIKEGNDYKNTLYLEDVKEFVDMHATMDLNDVKKYEYLNNFVTDDDITIDEVKRFRTWLAESLLELFLHEEDEHLVLNYYKGEMNDVTIDNIKLVYNSQYSLETLKTTTCGCISQNSMDTIDVNLCDPIATYRKDIYNKMVEMFSDIDYWVDRKLICPEIVKYLENIIRLNLPLVKTDYMTEFVDCTCTDVDVQSGYINILNQLIVAMNKIANDEVSGSRNFIQDTLKQWASLLYESMRWV